MSLCICEWPNHCGGSGMMHCDGCGGDLCVCGCGGEAECPGCDDCIEYGGDFGEDDEDAHSPSSGDAPRGKETER